MTVDESPVSPPPPSSGAQKAKEQQQQQQQKATQQQPRPPPPGGSSSSRSPLQPITNVSNRTFEAFARANPPRAKEVLAQLSEVTGVQDQKVLVNAFNATRKANGEYNVALAIDWILNLKSTQDEPTSFLPDLAPIRPTQPQQPQQQQPQQQQQQPQQQQPQQPQTQQPPNSPSNSRKQPLVDLTDQAPANKDQSGVDSDLEKAIKLSLQDANRGGGGGGGGQGSGFGVTQEEQDVSRALEASLLDNQMTGKRKRGAADNWVDPLNPHDRERNGMWPVGLKNVGQTCWFSAVMQSLFYLPAFRSLVLNFPPPRSKSEDKQQQQDDKMSFGNGGSDERQKKMAEFMQELRQLFALMVASQRKYVDPSRAVDILRGSIGTMQQVPLPQPQPQPQNKNNQIDQQSGNNSSSSSNNVVVMDMNNQQDVSEFTHIVLEWVEEAFKIDDCTMMDAEKENSEEKETENPMTKLFYGQVLTEGSIHGEPFAREEAFGQWPLQVNTFSNIHESLENSTAHESLDAVGPQQNNLSSSSSGQERWFLRLPPVLFFELSRFHYNTERRTAEKIHNRLEFPERIYMDRYMGDNKQVTRLKRDEVRALKEKRALLKTRLDKFVGYGSSSSEKRMPLPEILQSSLDFATAVAHSSSLHPSQLNTLMQVDSPCGSPKVTPATSLSNLPAAVEHSPMDVEMTTAASATEKDNSSSSSAHGCDSGSESTTTAAAAAAAAVGASSLNKQQDHSLAVADPSPRHVSDVELRVLQNCLVRWKQEVEQDMEGLESAIQGIDNQIENMYIDPSLLKLEYQLHAVMVHEGSVDSGHYWAYVLDHKRKVWLKFNDNTVMEASWEELAKESMGGHSNTSAYSLVYIDASKPDLLLDAEWAGSIGETQEDRMDQGELEALAVTLPQDLAQYVIDDNSAFHDEIVRWDKEQQELATKRQLEAEQQAMTTVVPDNKENSSIISTTTNNDVQVVQEKLTYVNTHAKLSVDLTIRVINYVEKIMAEKGPQVAVTQAMEKTITHYGTRKHETQEQDPGLPPRSDARLESFAIYLLRNGVSLTILEMAVLEQFSMPGLETTSSAFRQAAEQLLRQKHLNRIEDANGLKQWHQAYHWYRRSAHCFVAALEAFMQAKANESLDLFTEAYNYTLKANETTTTLSGPQKSLKPNLIARYLCKVLPEVNQALIKQFRLGERLNEVITSVQLLVVPVLTILQNRVNRFAPSQQQTNVAQFLDAQVLGEVRNEWCTLLGDTDATTEAASAISDVLPMILELDVGNNSRVPAMTATQPSGAAGATKNRDYVDQQADLRLSDHYKETVAILHDRVLKQKLPTPLQPQSQNE